MAWEPEQEQEQERNDKVSDKVCDKGLARRTSGVARIEPSVRKSERQSYALPVPLAGCFGVNVASDVTRELATQDARFVRRTVNEQIDRARAS